MREYLSAMRTGWDVETVKAIVADTLHHIVTPMIHEEAVELIDEHHAAGRDVVIVSSSGAEVVEPIGAMLGADKVIATRMVVADGKYTGEIEEYAYARTRRPRSWPWPRPRATTWRTPTPIRIPSPTSRCWLRWVTLRGQPGQGVTPARGRSGLAGAGLQRAGRPGRAKPPSRYEACLATVAVAGLAAGALFLAARRRARRTES